MTETADGPVIDPIFSDAEIAEFKVIDRGVGKTIGVMLAVLFSLFVPLMLFFWLGVDTVSARDDDAKLDAAAASGVESPGVGGH
jgi:hypothetical protein